MSGRIWYNTDVGASVHMAKKGRKKMTTCIGCILACPISDMAKTLPNLNEEEAVTE